MRSTALSRGWIGVMGLVAAGLVAWATVLVVHLWGINKQVAVQRPLLRQLDAAHDSVDRLAVMLPLLEERAVVEHVRAPHWSRPVRDLQAPGTAVPVITVRGRAMGPELLGEHLERIDTLAAVLAGAAGTPQRQAARRDLEAEVLRLHEHLGLLRGVVEAEFAEVPRRVERTTRQLAVVAALSALMVAGVLAAFLVYLRDYRRLAAAEHALQRSEERLRGILGGMQDVVWSATPDARVITYVSPAARTLFGLDPRAILKNPSLHLDHVHPDDRAAVRHFPDRLRDSPDGKLELEYRYSHPEGYRLWIQDRGWVVRDQAGRPTSVVAISKDVTARKDAELALQTSEVKYRRIVEGTADGIVVVDTTDRITFANPGLAEIFGTPREEIVGRSLHEFVEEQQAVLIHPHEDSGRFDASNQFEVEVLRGDGQKRQVRVTVAPIYDDIGRYMGTLGIYRDSTELIEAQITLIRELAFLSEIEVLGRSIVGQSDIRQIALDACGAAAAYGGVENAVIVFRNPSTGALSESASTFEGGGIDTHGLLPILQREEGIAGEVQAQRREATFGDLESPQTPGALRPLVHLGFRALIALPIRAGGRCFGILYGLDRRAREYDSEEVSRLRHLTILLGSALSNVSLYVRTEAANRELKAAVERLQEAERARDQFYRFLIHDLNKPLAAIIGTAGRLQMHPELPEKLGSRIERVENAALRLRDIVDHLLQHEQVRRQDFELRRESLSVWEQVFEALRLLEDKRRNLAVRINGQQAADPADLPRLFVQADATALRRILSNLIDNALEHAATVVEIDAMPQDEGLRLSVWNDGSTIADEEVDSIFREFYRGAGTRRAGYGLGLASVRRLMELHGGTVQLERPSRGGVCFSLLFPRANGAEPASGA